MNEINYLSFIQEVKEHIVRSRYIAATSVVRSTRQSRTTIALLFSRQAAF